MTDAYPQALLDKYAIVECLSASEQGETLLVNGRADDRYCIAKLTRGEADPEAALLETLSHPALPRYVERIHGDGVHISIREYIQGTPLDVYMRDRPLSDKQAVDIGIQLCDVLHYLHTQTPPIIHRDVKPQNVIITAHGRAVLIDFGIARRYKENARKDTVFSGTNDFAPPEQYGFSQTNARADVFSLGMLLRFLLTDGDIDAEVPDPYLRRVIRRCTAFSPDKRYRSVAQVKTALQRFGNRTRKRALMAAALAAAFVVGFAFGHYLPTASERSAQRQALAATQSPEEYARAEAYGFIPAELTRGDPGDIVVTWSAYCGMLGSMIQRYDDTLLPRWQELTENAPDTEMNRDGGMVALLFAGELMGIDHFNAQPPADFSSYAPKVWQIVTMDYPVFDWNRDKWIDAGCYDNNYVGPAYDYSVRRISEVTGMPLLEFDADGDLRLEQPFTLREATLSVLRLYESA